MHQFGPTASKLLQKCRELLKRHLPETESTAVLEKLRLHTRLPQHEADLYHMMTSAVKHFEEQIEKKLENRYSGTILFLRDMRDFLKCYRVEKNELIHAPQTAARAFVNAIQLIGVPEEKRTKNTIAELNLYMLEIVQYGEKEQQLAFEDLLKKSTTRDKKFFSPLLKKYQRYLGKYGEK